MEMGVYASPFLVQRANGANIIGADLRHFYGIKQRIILMVALGKWPRECGSASEHGEIMLLSHGCPPSDQRVDAAVRAVGVAVTRRDEKTSADRAAIDRKYFTDQCLMFSNR